MGDLFWPGDDRAGEVFGEGAFLDAMLAVEAAWLGALVNTGLAPAAAKDDLGGLVGSDDLAGIAAEAASTGNPAAPLVALLRRRLEPRNPVAAAWLHRGLTSQDVVDTALVLCLRDGLAAVSASLRAQTEALVALVEAHRDTPMVARTLTQHAVPTTFALTAATWLTGVLDAADAVDAVRLPVQVGGAAGTRAATVELAAATGDGERLASEAADLTAAGLGLAPALPWHTTRSPLTRGGDALVTCTDAWGHLAGDVLTLGRPEVGELAEGGGGGSSTMPHKANPVLSVLVRRAALTTPQLAATLHLAAATAVDQRPDGAWHAEWATLRTLVRRTVAAGAQVTDLLTGLVVNTDRMAATLAAAGDAVLSEQRSMAAVAGHPATDAYRGTTDRLVEGVLDRARTRRTEETG